MMCVCVCSMYSSTYVCTYIYVLLLLLLLLLLTYTHTFHGKTYTHSLYKFFKYLQHSHTYILYCTYIYVHAYILLYILLHTHHQYRYYICYVSMEDGSAHTYSSSSSDRLLCVVYTMEKNHDAVIAIANSWGSKCDGFIAFRFPVGIVLYACMYVCMYFVYLKFMYFVCMLVYICMYFAVAAMTILYAR